MLDTQEDLSGRQEMIAQRRTLANALRAAASKWDEYVLKLALPGLKSQFAKQAAEVRALAYAIERADTIRLED